MRCVRVDRVGMLKETATVVEIQEARMVGGGSMASVMEIWNYEPSKDLAIMVGG